MAQVNVTIYKFEGKYGPFKIKQECGECSLSLRIIKDVIKEFGDEIEFKEEAWLTNWYKPIWKGGWHAPIVLVNGKILSQGVVVDRDALRSRIVTELYKDYMIEEGIHLFTLPNCKHCTQAKKILKKHKVKYTERDVLKNTTEMQKLLTLILGKIHPITLPQLFINKVWIKGGATRLTEMDKSGELTRMLQKKKQKTKKTTK